MLSVKSGNYFGAVLVGASASKNSKHEKKPVKYFTKYMANEMLGRVQ